MSAHDPELQDAHLVDDLESSLDAARTETKLSRSAVPRDLLRTATRAGLLRMALEEWAMLALLWIAMSIAPWWCYPVLALLVAGRLHALGILMHDCSHMPMPGSRKDLVVRVLEVLCAYPIATTMNAMRYHHLRHHRDSGMRSDPYFKANLEGRPLMYALNVLRGAVLIPFWTLRVPVGLLAVVWPRARNVYGRVWLQDKSGKDLTHSREVVDCGRAELGQGVFQALVIAAWIAWPREVLFGYVIPVTITGLLAAWRLLQEHNYVRAEDRSLATILATTNDHHIRWVDKLVLAPRNIGHHVAHHLHPQVGLEHLPALRAWYAERFPDRYPRPQ
ncbi:fatty acid desaturase family protein [Sandaracinus amylolyticus]|uniref:fatty acid desaturase family protein n=1 Tax=Sandaracinus amylolyticus TaxID=927083 RepID=UPI001F01B70F|nr:fatty acid desaturase [Sandaracinus amylolyticus]UJR81097.1 Fatty acid desaturase [Sandaracinus amylolyticus]